jgi:hypothetical protein
MIFIIPGVTLFKVGYIENVKGVWNKHKIHGKKYNLR